MGMIYRRKKRDPATGLLVETGPHWMKYYSEWRPIQESTRTVDRVEAKRLLKGKKKERLPRGFSGPKIERIRFEDLAALVKQDYQINKRKTARRVDEYMSHLKTFFRQMRATSITTERIKTYIVKRQHQGAANGTINRELACLKRMFRLGFQQTPQLVLRVPHIPQLKEHNIRSGFFEHETPRAPRRVTRLCASRRQSCLLQRHENGRSRSLQWTAGELDGREAVSSGARHQDQYPSCAVPHRGSYRVLHAWKRRCDIKWPACLWICHRGGNRLQSLKHSWRKACQAIGVGHMVKDATKGRKVWQGKIPHDFRRTAVRNMVRAGVPEKVAMAISGHKTRACSTGTTL